MNKYQEAKSNIVNTLIRQIGFEAYNNLYEKSFEILQEPIDKTTPKKVFIYDNDCFCPNCKTSLVDVRKDAYKSFISRYCTWCGQALDWSEDE